MHLEKDNLAINPLGLARLYVKKANSKRKKRRSKEAELDFRRAKIEFEKYISLDAFNPEVYEEYADILMRLGHLKLASYAYIETERLYDTGRLGPKKRSLLCKLARVYDKLVSTSDIPEREVYKTYARGARERAKDCFDDLVSRLKNEQMGKVSSLISTNPRLAHRNVVERLVQVVEFNECGSDEEIIEVASIRKEGWLSLKKLGTGVYGRVYLAKNQVTNVEAALKLLYLSERGRANLKRRGLTEEQLTEKEGGVLLKANELNNPHIIIGHDVGYDKEMKRFFILMELVDDSLHNIIMGYWQKEGKHLPFEWVIDSMLQLSDGVGALHQRSEVFPHGNVHGDISPKNIGVKHRKSGSIYKAMDFGLSSCIKGIDPRYDSPNVASICTRARELFDGKPPDTRSDVYAIGATYYWVIFNRYPHEPDMKKPEMPGSERSRYEEAVKNHHDRVSLDELFKGSDIPKPLEDVLRKCLTKDPNQRYQNAYESKKALQDVKKGLS